MPPAAQYQQQQRNQLPPPPHNADPTIPPAPAQAQAQQQPSPLVPRQWLKFLLVVLSGFLLGVVLGMLSTSLVFWFIPAPWLEHALKYRKEKLQEHAELRQMCTAATHGFIERYDPVEHAVQICACWPKGLSEMGGWFVSCAGVGLMGYSEVGSWGTEIRTLT